MKILSVLIAISLLLFVSFDSFALDPNPPGELSVVISVSDTPDFIKQWVRTHPEKPGYIKNLNEVSIGHLFHVAFIVTGYEINNKGKADLVGDFILLAPDGSIGAERKDTCINKQYMKKYPIGFVMLDPAIDLRFEEGTPLGVYVVKAIVRDKVSNKIVVGEYSITLKAK